MSTTTQPAKPVRGSIKKVFNTIGASADAIRIGVDIININLRGELAIQTINVVRDVASELGITEAQAKILIEGL